MTLCANPGGCGHARSSHDPAAGLHPCKAAGCTCPTWILPPCGDPACGDPTSDHAIQDPHACNNQGKSLGHCNAYVFPDGETRDTYEGGGGGFGGGGASGGW